MPLHTRLRAALHAPTTYTPCRIPLPALPRDATRLLRSGFRHVRAFWFRCHAHFPGSRATCRFPGFITPCLRCLFCLAVTGDYRYRARTLYSSACNCYPDPARYHATALCVEHRLANVSATDILVTLCPLLTWFVLLHAVLGGCRRLRFFYRSSPVLAVPRLRATSHWTVLHMDEPTC